MPDQTIQCKGCGQDFVWTTGDQEFYQTRGFSAPLWCKPCRDKRKQERHGGGSASTEIICRECGKKDTVPFEVKGDPNSLLCQECFGKQRGQEPKPAQEPETTEQPQSDEN